MKDTIPLLSVVFSLDGGSDDYQRIQNLKQALRCVGQEYEGKLSILVCGDIAKSEMRDIQTIASDCSVTILSKNSCGSAIMASDGCPYYELQLISGFISPNFFQNTLDALKNSIRDGIYIPSGVVGYGVQDIVIDFRKNSQTVLMKMLHDGLLPLNLPVVYPVLHSMQPTFSLVQAGLQIRQGLSTSTINNTLYFYRSIDRNTNTENNLVRNDLLEPNLFANLELMEVPYVKNTKNQKTILNSLRIRHPAAFEYVRGQYHLNRHYLGLLYAKLNWKFSKKVEISKAISKLGDEDVLLNTSWIRQWAELNSIEPMIRPSLDIIRKLKLFDQGYISEFSNRYIKFCKKYRSEKITDIVILPHLVRGGADLAAINFIKALSESGRYPLVILSLEVESPWAHKIIGMSGVHVMEAREWFAGLEEDRRALFVARIVAQWDVTHLSVINSSLGYRVIEDYGSIIRTNCKILLHTYAFDMTSDGFIFNVLQDGIKKCSQNVDLLITDSKSYKQQLMAVYGFESAKIIPLYIPASGQDEGRNKVSRKILWASRISDAKLVEVAVEVGKLLDQIGVELHFYGALDESYRENDYFLNLIAGYENIHYHGVYEGFHSISLNEYDAFMLTTKNEGMPNVVLEALLANLFVFAPAVGGVPETLTNYKNGILIHNNFEPKEYFNAISTYYNSPHLQKPKLRKGYNEKIRNRHSWPVYFKAVRSITSKNINLEKSDTT